MAERAPVGRRDIKVACLNVLPNQVPHLFVFSQSKPLIEVLKEVCANFDVKDHERYAFKSQDSGLYITEKNRSDLRDGAVLKLELSPSESAQLFVDYLKGRDPSKKKDTLTNLRDATKDATFVNKFLEKGGLPVLMKLINEFKAGQNEQGNLGFALSGYFEIMSHRQSEWNNVERPFIVDIISLVVPGKKRDEVNPTVVRNALLITASYVRFAGDGFSVVTSSLKLTDIKDHMKTDDFTRRTALTLFNALLRKAPNAQSRNEVFATLDEHRVIETTLSEPVRKSAVDDALAHQLYVLQTLWLNRLSARRNCFYNAEDKDCEKNLRLLINVFNELESANPMQAEPGAAPRSADPYKKLGFTLPHDPADEFLRPPGILCLDNMAYFAKTYADHYNRIVLEQLSKPEIYACPFAKASTRLVELLLELLDVDKEISETSTRYMPLFFTCNEQKESDAFVTAFKELFSVSIQLLFKTWKEMEAKTDDFDKVLMVVRKQLLCVLEGPVKDMPTSIDQLRTVLMQLTYQEIHKKELHNMELQQERQLQSETVKRLQERQRARLHEIVKEQRLSYLVQGDWFGAPKQGKGKAERFFCCLAPNHKTIHWGEPEASDLSDAKPSLTSLKNQCECTDLKQFHTGASVPSMLKKKHTDPTLIFAFQNDQEEVVEFIASTRRQAAIWIDGLRVLRGKPVEEPETKNDLTMLLEVERDICLLNVTGIELPLRAPMVPDLPLDLNFYYSELDQHSTA